MYRLLFGLLLCVSITTYADSSKYTYDNALQLHKQGDNKTAIIYLRNVLSDTPDNLAAQILYGQILLQQQLFAEALNVFEGALTDGADINLISDELSYLYLLSRQKNKLQEMLKYGELRQPQKFNWLLVSASLDLQTNDLEQARSTLKTAATLFPQNVNLLNAQAELALAEKAEDRAAELLAQSLQLEPNNSATLLQLGHLAFIQKRYPAAIAHYQTGLALDPNNPLLLRAISTVQFLTGQLGDARNALEQLSSMGLDDAYLRFALPMVTALQDKTAVNESIQTLHADLIGMPAEYFKAEPDKLFLRATLHYLNNNEFLAIEDFNNYLQLKPNDLNAIDIVANYYIRNELVGTAVKFLDDNKAYIKDYAPLQLQHALLAIKQQRPYVAQQMLTEMRARFPDNAEMAALDAELKRQTLGPAAALAYLSDSPFTAEPSVLLSKTLLAKDLNDFPRARDFAQQLLALQPEDPTYRNIYAGILVSSGDLTEAEKQLSQLLQAKPDFFPGQLTQANLLILQRDFVAAAKLLKQLIELQPQNDTLQVLQAQVELQTNNSEQAVERLVKIVNRQHHRPSLNLLLAHYFSVNKQKEALGLIQRSLRREFMAKDLLLLEANTLITLNQITEAQEKVSQFAQLADLNDNHYYELGLLQKRLERYADASNSFATAIKLAPDNLIYDYELINLQLDTAQLKQAEQRLQQLAQRQVQSADYYLLAGLLAEQQQNPALAFKNYLKSIEQNPRFQRAWGMAYELSRQATFNERFTTLAQQHLKLQPNDFWVKRLLAEHHINHQQWPEASTLYQQLLAAGSFTDDAFLQNNLANALFTSDPALALQHAAKANQLRRNEPLILTTYAKALLQNQQAEQALAILYQAYAQQSSNNEINLLLAETLVSLQRATEAKPYIDAVRQNATDAATRERVAALLARLAQ
ncbi:MAG: tetratricopeptide repeat protein [Alishewanella sp.]|nr:tetratricopeptide repeat protein [Alishewanella sp.]